MLFPLRRLWDVSGFVLLILALVTVGCRSTTPPSPASQAEMVVPPTTEVESPIGQQEVPSDRSVTYYCGSGDDKEGISIKKWLQKADLLNEVEACAIRSVLREIWRVKGYTSQAGAYAHETWGESGTEPNKLILRTAPDSIAREYSKVRAAGNSLIMSLAHAIETDDWSDAEMTALVSNLDTQSEAFVDHVYSKEGDAWQAFAIEGFKMAVAAFGKFKDRQADIRLASAEQIREHCFFKFESMADQNFDDRQDCDTPSSSSTSSDKPSTTEDSG